MKKILLLAAVACMTMTSCKKNYTCECTQTGSGTTPVVTDITIKDTKSKATTACTALNTSASSGGVTETTNCVIK